MEEENIEIFLNDTIDTTTIKKQTDLFDKTTKNTDWDDIEQLMKSLTNTTGSVTDRTNNMQESDSKNVSELLHTMSNIDHNSSGMLLHYVININYE